MYPPEDEEELDELLEEDELEEVFPPEDDDELDDELEEDKLVGQLHLVLHIQNNFCSPNHDTLVQVHVELLSYVEQP